MKIIDEGHKYEIPTMYGSEIVQLQFIKKDVNKETGKFDLTYDGITNEELLKVLINRLSYLYNKLPDDYTKEALLSIEKAEDALLSRTDNRKKRKVEGTHKA